MYVREKGVVYAVSFWQYLRTVYRISGVDRFAWRYAWAMYRRRVVLMLPSHDEFCFFIMTDVSRVAHSVRDMLDAFDQHPGGRILHHYGVTINGLRQYKVYFRLCPLQESIALPAIRQHKLELLKQDKNFLASCQAFVINLLEKR